MSRTTKKGRKGDRRVVYTTSTMRSRIKEHRASNTAAMHRIARAPRASALPEGEVSS